MKAILKLLASVNGLVRKAGAQLQSPLLLVFRLHWGWKFFKTGKGKLLHHDNIVTYFGNLGIPLPELNAWIAAGVECFGGILLMLGLLSRPTAVLTAFTMVVAYVAEDKDRAKLLAIFDDPEPFLEAAPFFFLLTSLLVLAFGPGKFSLDYLIARRWSAKKGSGQAHG